LAAKLQNMDNLNIKLHDYQKDLIKKLTLKPTGIRFNDLLIDGLESEHMNYHLKQLIAFGFIEKKNSIYSLTDEGKDYSNLIDSETELLEKMPKTSIVIRGVKKNEEGNIEHLLTRRLRQPYFGKVGRITGKVRFGETLRQTAERELYEESGLRAKSFNLELIYRKMRQRENGEWVQDVIFYVFLVKNFDGNLIKNALYQENFWITKKDFYRQRVDAFEDLVLEDRLKAKSLTLVEDINIAQGF